MLHGSAELHIKHTTVKDFENLPRGFLLMVLLDIAFATPYSPQVAFMLKT